MSELPNYPKNVLPETKAALVHTEELGNRRPKNITLSTEGDPILFTQDILYCPSTKCHRAFLSKCSLKLHFNNECYNWRILNAEDFIPKPRVEGLQQEEKIRAVVRHEVELENFQAGVSNFRHQLVFYFKNNLPRRLPTNNLVGHFVLTGVKLDWFLYLFQGRSDRASCDVFEGRWQMDFFTNRRIFINGIYKYAKDEVLDRLTSILQPNVDFSDVNNMNINLWYERRYGPRGTQLTFVSPDLECGHKRFVSFVFTSKKIIEIVNGKEEILTSDAVLVKFPRKTMFMA